MDRNLCILVNLMTKHVAPRRGAWIEIRAFWPLIKIKESRTPQGCVDRNLQEHYINFAGASRTPQGCVDRNLLSLLTCRKYPIVAPRRGAWIEIINKRPESP